MKSSLNIKIMTARGIAISLLLVILHSCQNDYFVPKPRPIPETSDPTEVLEAKYVTQSPDKINSAYWKTADYLPVTLQDVSTGNLYGDGLLNTTGTLNGLLDFNSGESVDLTLKAAYDDNKVYILVEWNDDDKDASRYSMLYNGHPDENKPTEDTMAWTSQRNDDQMALAFNISVPDFDANGCQTACHSGAMNTVSGSLDIWNWSLALSEPLGYALDMNCTDQGLVNDAGTPLYYPNMTSGYRSGPLYVWNGVEQNVIRRNESPNKLDPGFYIYNSNKEDWFGDIPAGLPYYEKECGKSCHGKHGEGGGPSMDGPAFNIPGQMNKYSYETFVQYAGSNEHSGAAYFDRLNDVQRKNVLAVIRGFTGVPGHILQDPSGSSADIGATSNVITARVTPEGTRYSVLIVRDLNTGNADDIQFDPDTKESYTFGIALMDGDGANHIGSLKETLTFIKP